jgi:hypothetical protein
MMTVPWKAVVTGDVVVVLDKEEFPADVVLLATSEELGKCYTEVPRPGRFFSISWPFLSPCHLLVVST